MENQEKKAPAKLEMLNLNQPNVKGVGVFFAVCRTAIASCSWARNDFDAVRLVEGQLDYLERYCLQEFSNTPVPEVAPKQDAPEVKAEATETADVKTETTKPVEKPETPATEEEVIDLHDKGEKRKVPMPDSILEKVMEGVEATKNFEQNPPKDPVKAEPLPSSPAEYEQVF